MLGEDSRPERETAPLPAYLSPGTELGRLDRRQKGRGSRHRRRPEPFRKLGDQRPDRRVREAPPRGMRLPGDPQPPHGRSGQLRPPQSRGGDLRPQEGDERCGRHAEGGGGCRRPDRSTCRPGRNLDAPLRQTRRNLAARGQPCPAHRLPARHGERAHHRPRPLADPHK